MIAVLEFPGASLLGWLAACAAEPAADRARADAEERALAREVARRPDRFQVLYGRYYERILNFFYRRVRERAVAEDLTSQVFLAALEYLTAAERELHFRPWLYRVATNAWLTHERRRQRWGERIIDQIGRWLGTRHVPTPGQALSDRERAEALRRALMSLPVLYREPILLRCDEELSDEEIGAALGLTPGGVRSRISRGLARLRHRVQPLLSDEFGVNP